MRVTVFLLLLLLTGRQGFAAVRGPAGKPHADLPDDKPRQHVETVTAGRHSYTVRMAGTVDGAMLRTPIGYKAFTQAWQPDRFVRIENVGDSDLANPRIVVNGKRAWWTIADAVADATRGATTPAERARALWEFSRRVRFHACTWDNECYDTLKVLHVYGYTLCGNQSRVLNDLWKTAGLKVRRGYPVGHSVAEVFYDGGYHLMDADEHVICLKRDNKTIASCEEVTRDHDLLKRTHSYGILQTQGRATDEGGASLYGYEGRRKGDLGFHCRHSMDLTLRPGESIELRWDHAGKEYTAGTQIKAGERRRDGMGGLIRWGPAAYANLRNGKIRYQPDLTAAVARRGAAVVENAVFARSAGAIRPAAKGKPAAVTWRFAGPYVFVGGRAVAEVRLEKGASAKWQYSTDGKAWRTLATLSAAGEAKLTASLDEVVSPRRKPTYRFQLRLVLAGAAVAGGVAFEHDIQTSTLALPELARGANEVVYTDANGKDPKRRVRVTHDWMERKTWRPPAAPPAAVAPADGATVKGSRVAFRWQPPADPDGDKIADYHFELSGRADMRWPLSPNFERLSLRTPSKGKPQWTTPYVGLLNPDTTYYWRVRARDAKGVWGPWSRVFKFRIAAPGVPLAVKLAPDAKAGLTLSWRANPAGERPVAYKVYGSDEKGFTASDTDYRVRMGKGFIKTMAEYEAAPAPAAGGAVKTPANLIARVTAASLPVVGPGLTAANTNKAFYRVVAVDAAGNESGASDYAEAPRPYLVLPAAAEAAVGKPYRLPVKTIRSLGDLRCRPSKKSSYNSAFWDREQVALTAAALPPGLTLDPKTTTITGTPTRPGTFTIKLTASISAAKSTSAELKLVVRP